MALLNGIGTASIYHWYGEEKLVRRGGVATGPGWSAGNGGLLEEPLFWYRPNGPRPAPSARASLRSQPDLDAANLRFLDGMGAGAVAIYMLVDDGARSMERARVTFR